MGAIASNLANASSMRPRAAPYRAHEVVFRGPPRWMAKMTVMAGGALSNRAGRQGGRHGAEQRAA